MRVLIVEDNHTLASNIRRALRRTGMAADIVHDGGTALAACTTTDFDVIVLDRRLPTVSGDEVCARLVATSASPRVLIVTSMDGTLDEIDGLNLGADDYIAKPFEMPVLVARVRALARRPPRAIAPVLHAGEPAWHRWHRDGYRHSTCHARWTNDSPDTQRVRCARRTPRR